jgi:UV DNA damage endonuclease
MRIGYPCINRGIGCTANTRFILANYSRQNLFAKVKNNLDCLQRILEYNLAHQILFFRISSDLVPFASHPVCTHNWLGHFSKEFRQMGMFIKKHRMRVSMHPDQFVLLNALDKKIVVRSIAELRYHCQVFDAMGLDATAKVQIHVGGVYGDKPAAIKRFVAAYKSLPRGIKKRLVVENDDRLYRVADCLAVHRLTGVPLVLDTFHHQCLNNGETINAVAIATGKTWQTLDGPPILDYSSQKHGARRGAHAEHLQQGHFITVIDQLPQKAFDLMLEIKDKEQSALRAMTILQS